MRNRIHIKRDRPSAAVPGDAAASATAATAASVPETENARGVPETSSEEEAAPANLVTPDEGEDADTSDATDDEEVDAVPEWKAAGGERKHRRVTSIDVYRNSADQADENGVDEEVDSPSDGNRNGSSKADLALFKRRNTDLVRAPAEWRMLALSPRGLVPVSQEKPVAANAPRLEETSDYFFQLYTGLERLIGEDRYILGVTSAVRGEGKTTIALHLALAAVRSSYRRVCLVDLSMGEDDLCRRLGVAPAPGGVVTLLEGDDGEHPRLAVLECRGVEQLSFVPAAGVPRKAARAVRSPRLPALLSGLRDEYDLVIVDLPSVRSNNATPLSPLLDGILMVARAGTTPRGVVQNAIDQVGRERVLSLVLNRTKNWRKSK